MQLLKIMNIPIEYKFEIEPARLEMKQAQNPRHKLAEEPSELQIRSRNVQVRMDSTQLRASLNLRNNGDFARFFSGRGAETAYQAVGDAVQMGNQMAQIQDGQTIAQIVRQKWLQQPTTYTTFLPSAGTDLSWEPAELDLDYDPGSLSVEWEVMRNLMDYVPGKFHMNIMQYPKVEIEYLGEPNYVPPSANPNYEGKSA